MSDVDAFILRRNDFTLSDDQESLREAFRTFFDRECPAARVRGAEPTGWDPALWAAFVELGAVTMGVPASAGGDGAGLVELAIVAQELGRRAAPLPFVETAVAARLLAAVGADPAAKALDDVLAGAVASVSLAPPTQVGRVLVAAGAIAGYVLGLRGDALVLTMQEQPVEAVPNLADSPLAWRDLTGAVVVASGQRAREYFAAAAREWRVLMAAALVGVGESALQLGVEYARQRQAFGAAIGSFQAVAHPLVDAAIAVEGAGRLVRKAAWVGDHEPERFGRLALMAFLQAAAAAETAGETAIHTQGGFGFALESDVQLFYRRAKGWPLVAGDRRAALRLLADEVLPRVPPARAAAAPVADSWSANTRPEAEREPAGGRGGER